LLEVDRLRWENEIIRVADLPLENRIKEYFQEKGISTLYPPQEEAIKTGILDGKNVVLAIPTASGKTLIAEFCMLKSILEQGGKALYLCPLRALASEKYEEFQTYSKLGVNVGITTGDYDTVEEKYGTYDLLICTNERADSLLRHRAKWMSQIAIVIADEVHLINDPGRGPTLEVVLARLRQIAPKAQILALSATVDNAEELAEWLKGDSVVSDWRPVTLREGVYYDGKVFFGDDRDESYSPSTAFPIGDITRRVLRKKGQLLAFLNTRRSAVRTAQKLSSVVAPRLKRGEQEQLGNLAEKLLHLGEVTQVSEALARNIRAGVAFHHAGLRYSERKLIEEAFRNNLIKVICATPTLCLGPNTKIWHELKETKVTAFNNTNQLYVLSKNRLVPGKAIEIVSLENSDPLIEFSSVSGYQIQVTQNHRMLVKRNNNRVLIPAKEIEKHDKLATARRVLLQKHITYHVRDFVIDNKTTKENYEINLDCSYFLGLMLGDGYSGAESNGDVIRYKGSPSIVGLDDEILAHAKQTCADFSISTRKDINPYGIPELVLGKNKWFREFLVRCGVEKGNKKYIHPKLMKMDNSSIAALLRGLFDTDGYVVKEKEIGLSNSSKELIMQSKKLLLRFGIVSRLRSRKKGRIKYAQKEYATEPYFELLINQNQSILDFEKYIGFGIKRKATDLQELVSKIQKNVLYIACPNCAYRIFNSLFVGRSKSQREWGKKKYAVIKLLGEKGELGSNEIEKTLGFKPRKDETRLNHHYELISKRKIGKRSKTEWFWSLNEIGKWIYSNYLVTNQDLSNFSHKSHCPLCQTELERKLRGTWRSNDLDNDIFWDKIREIKTVNAASTVFDVVLSPSNNHDHMIVANGFIVHNSAGVNLPARVVIIQEYRRFDRIEGYQPIPVLEYKQMAGRAGRPKYDKNGTAILLARNEGERDFLLDYYILGNPESIISKLASESALRSHVLSTIAMKYASDKEGIMNFIRQTFFGHQRDPDEVEYMIDLIVKFLKDEALLEQRKMQLSATSFGRRTSQLYIDPKSAVIIRDGLSKASNKIAQFTDVSFLHLICHTPDMANLYLRRGEDERFHDYVIEHLDEFLIPIPDPRYHRDRYEFFLAEVKTALLTKAWIEELPEDQLINQFKIGSGDLLRLVDTQAWLLYACRELAPIFSYKKLIPELKELELRVRYGVRRELAELVELQGIGRIRARFLFRAGFISKNRIRDAPIAQLASIPTIGPQIAKSIKQQCGGAIKPEDEQALKGTRRQNTRQTQLTLD
jgi:helicase